MNPFHERVLLSGLPIPGWWVRQGQSSMLMSQFPRARDLALWPILFALLSAACSRPVGVRTGDSSQGAPAAEDRASQSESGVPFQDAQSLPAGTLLTVRLQGAIAADDSNASRAFDAVVDEAVLVEGTVLLPRGVSVAGRVESARASESRRNAGYVKLTLDSIKIAGREQPIQTSSLYVRGKADNTQVSRDGASLQIVRLEGGRRLTFRLTEPVPIANPPAPPVH
jgi:hypothetical protein